MLAPISWRSRRPKRISARSWIAISIANRHGVGSAMRGSWKTTQPQPPRRWQATNQLAVALQTAETTQGTVRRRRQEQVPHKSHLAGLTLLLMTRFYRSSKRISIYLILLAII